MIFKCFIVISSYKIFCTVYISIPCLITSIYRLNGYAKKKLLGHPKIILKRLNNCNMRISCMKYLYMLKTSGTKKREKRWHLQGTEHGIYYMMIKADFSCVTENLYLTNIGIYSSISHMCLNNFTFQKSIPILRLR